MLLPLTTRCACAAVLVALALPAAAADLPHVAGSLACTRYDGASDDLLTAGLGKSGLAGPAPKIADPARPTAAELRRAAIHANYRALADMTPNGGYGRLYGPNIDLTGRDTLGEGKVAGEECLAYWDDGSGRRNVTMMVQIPERFDRENPCIVAAPSSGSRGVYGAVGAAGEWGLKRGCAVAYTDKGTGSGVHALADDSVNLMTGERAAASAGARSNFTASLTAAERAAFEARWPGRYAIKHAHSGFNPESRWGDDVLQSIRFAFHVLNERHGVRDAGGRVQWRSITKRNTIVIAASVSNGGGASLAAAERDVEGLIDAVVVSEPQVQVRRDPQLVIQRGQRSIRNHSKSLYDYVTLANLYQPCAALAPSNLGAPGAALVNPAAATARCTALRMAGLLRTLTLPEQAAEAQRLLDEHGWEPESAILGPSHFGLQIAPAVAVTYANAYGRFGVTDNLCGFSFGGTDKLGAPAPVATPVIAAVFASGNGIPPTAGINIINNDAVGGPRLLAMSVSRSTKLADFNADGARCLRGLFTGDSAPAQRVRAGVAAVMQQGDLRGKPAIIVHGRDDNLVPVNHSSRPYFALNKRVEGDRSRLRYYEVTNAQHFEAFMGILPLLAGYDSRYIPMHVYNIRALDLMYAHLKAGTPLPDSQVVRTRPRGGLPGAAPAISTSNVPPIAAVASQSDVIVLDGRTLRVPD